MAEPPPGPSWDPWYLDDSLVGNLDELFGSHEEVMNEIDNYFPDVEASKGMSLRKI